MIQQIINFFNQNLKTVDTVNPDYQLNLATASLLIEMVRMDHKIEQSEHDMVKSLLKNNFGLSNEETDTLFELAEEEAANAVDYYRFARLINKEYDNVNKIKLVENLWHIAYADGQLDKYEEHYLRKVAELLHVPHKEFIKAKHRVLDNPKD